MCHSFFMMSLLQMIKMSLPKLPCSSLSCGGAGFLFFSFGPLSECKLSSWVLAVCLLGAVLDAVLLTIEFTSPAALHCTVTLQVTSEKTGWICWCYAPVIPAFWRWQQKDHEFESSQGFRVRAYLCLSMLHPHTYTKVKKWGLQYPILYLTCAWQNGDVRNE